MKGGGGPPNRRGPCGPSLAQLAHATKQIGQTCSGDCNAMAASLSSFHAGWNKDVFEVPQSCHVYL